MVGFIMRDQAVLLPMLLPGLVDVCAPAPARVRGGWGNRARQDGRRRTTSRGARTRPEPTTPGGAWRNCSRTDNVSRGRDDDDDDDGGGLLTAGDKGNYGATGGSGGDGMGLTDWEEAGSLLSIRRRRTK